ncbi:unnamed protein product [Soboliphyme baturini]|uniref:Signal recognition particle receptor subunit beta n=1 Tax=Soboliphyme baturini TaxID=241478 RepID=A0A183ITR2_9BILA|nr:unnamed protein product [Soboliphyme baturini]
MDMTVDTVKNVTGVIAASVPVPILVAIVVVVISTILMLLVLLLGQSTRKTLLLCGITNSGKTLMFVELAVGHSVKTVTSMKENVHEIAIPGFPVQLVEIPGSDRIRKTILDNYLKVRSSSAYACIPTFIITIAKEDVPYMIFVVDSSSFMKECREVAEFLYDILSTKEVVKRGKRFSLLIACSKQDIPTAKSSQVIKVII